MQEEVTDNGMDQVRRNRASFQNDNYGMRSENSTQYNDFVRRMNPSSENAHHPHMANTYQEAGHTGRSFSQQQDLNPNQTGQNEAGRDGKTQEELWEEFNTHFRN